MIKAKKIKKIRLSLDESAFKSYDYYKCNTFEHL
jgi:hypothetical protein